MLQKLLADHVSGGHWALARKLVPKLEVLVELCPTLGDSGGDQGKEIVQKCEDELILGTVIFRKQTEGLILKIVTKGSC